MPFDRKSVRKICRFYCFIGCAWIVLSDGFVFFNGGISTRDALISMIKGLVFVLTTALALYVYATKWLHGSVTASKSALKRLALIGTTVNDILLLMDASGQILEANDRAVACYGYALDDLLKMSVRQLQASEGRWVENWDRVVDEGSAVFEAEHARADGTTFPVEVSSRKIDVEGTFLIQSAIRDISERKRAEQEIVRLKDTHAALSQTNQCIVRISDRDLLLQMICDIAVEFGHFKMAWIGFVEEHSLKVTPAASAGDEVGYLDDITVSADPSSPYGHGPVGQSILTGVHKVDLHFSTSQTGQPWHRSLREHGLNAIASFPLCAKGKPIGAFALYSEDGGHFSEELIQLLDEMASDVSFALDRIEMEEDRARLQAALQSSAALVQGIIDGSRECVAAIDCDGKLTLCNAPQRRLLRELFGTDPGLGANLLEQQIQNQNGKDDLLSHWKEALAGERSAVEWSFESSNGEKTLHSYFAPLVDASHRVIGSFHVGHDVTDYKRMSSELRKVWTAIEQSPVAVVIADRSGVIEYVNPAFVAIAGYREEEALGQGLRILKNGDPSPEAYEAMLRDISEGKCCTGVFQNHRKDGSVYWGDSMIAPVRDADGSIKNIIAIQQDVTSRREAEETARFLAFHDPLTSLPNRLVGRSEMQKAIARAMDSGRHSALLFIDLDDFKRINDSLGHRVGDHLLQAVAERLQTCVRENDTLSRVGGDEFLIVISEAEGTQAVTRVAERIIANMATPFHVDGLELNVTVSIGVASYPDHGDEFEVLHRHADLAMYAAKRAGRNTYQFYAEEMGENAGEHFLIRNTLNRALAHKEFVLYYQPIVNVEDGSLVGAEALVRWRHPDLGLLLPCRFIPASEDSGHMVQLGAWILSEACAQASAWQRLGMGKLPVAVNLSAVQFKRGDLIESVSEALAQAALHPACLNLEITESILIEDRQNVSDKLAQLKRLDVGIALDDFGTGYSSLTYLRSFPLSKLKIDRSFVSEIASSREDEAIVRSVVQLAHDFGLRTVAEGVESHEALDALRRVGCDEAQGYLFARPLTAEDFLCFATERRTV